MKKNEDILQERVTAFNNRPGPRVGDYVFIPSDDDRIPEYTRITHDWGDLLQTGGLEGGSYYLSNSGYLSYSGRLDPGITTISLMASSETKPGQIWFFDGDISGAGRGVTFSVPMRVFKVKVGADIHGIYSRTCPYYLDVRPLAREGEYRYLITKHATSHTAFRTENELRLWLGQNRLGLTAELPTDKNASQSLKYIQDGKETKP